MDRLDYEIGRARDPQVAEALTNAKAVLEKRSRGAVLSPDEQAAFSDIQGRSYDVDRMKEAAGSGGALTGFKIPALVRRYGAQPDEALNATNQELIGPLGRTIYRAPNQDDARQLYVTLGKMGLLGTLGVKTGGIGAAAMVPLYGASLAGQTATGARALTGQTGWQKRATAALDSPQTGQSVTDALRNGVDMDSLTFANMLRSLRDNASNQGASFTGN
jgi:hypothetical protein